MRTVRAAAVWVLETVVVLLWALAWYTGLGLSRLFDAIQRRCA